MPSVDLPPAAQKAVAEQPGDHSVPDDHVKVWSAACSHLRTHPALAGSYPTEMSVFSWNPSIDHHLIAGNAAAG
jgi:hypothetical protein